jgi:hypothetical protein
MKKRLLAIVAIAAIAAIALTAALAATACDDPNHDVGARCTRTNDCTPPLVCSNRDATDGTLGICVYPEALPDAGPSTDDLPDAAPSTDAAPSADASGV